MDNSVQVKYKRHYDRRVGISNGEIVVLDGDVRNGYHGYVRTWEELTKQMRCALIDNGLANDRGKIL